ncbi:MAG: hypothetical protein DIU76_00675 [Bacillota bacterium]|nr:MAG: hypothetical protein DIU76_00675 [Bacillota bacterium]
MVQWAGDRVRRGPGGPGGLVGGLAAEAEAAMGEPVAYVLNRTALLGVLATLEREGAVRAEVRDGRWWWAAASEVAGR